MFDIYVDGEKMNEEPYDLYQLGSDAAFKQVVAETELPYGEHTVTLVIVGRNPSSIGNNVYVDAVGIIGEFIESTDKLVDDEALVITDQPMSINVMTNDDIPADTAITEFTQPESGSVKFENGMFVFTPEKMDLSDDEFTYSYGGETATVALKYAGSIRYEDTLKAVRDGLGNESNVPHGWGDYSLVRYSGGSAIRSGQAGDTITVKFYGAGIEIIGYKSWSRGIVDITVDGVKTAVDTFDMTYDKTYGQPIYAVSGLNPDNEHTLTIKVTGDRFFLASGGAIDIDAFVVTK